MPGLSDYDKRQAKILAKLIDRIKSVYNAAIIDIAFFASNTPSMGGKFSLSLYPALEKTIQKKMAGMHKELYAIVTSGIKQSWGNANDKNDLIVDKRLASKKPSIRAKQILYDPNMGAMNAFISRTEKGMDLSKRVWKSVKPFKKELEQSLGLGISEGKSAKAMASDIKEYLNHPDKLFHRVRGEDGRLYLSQAARNYESGKGRYKSSYKNALRVTRTETNMAYRAAHHERWQTLPFVKGVHIKLSNNHPKYDICDELKGMYPKDFKFVGWHPQCLCYAVPEMMSDEEYDKLEDQILNGDPITPAEGVTKPPPGFTNWVKDNKTRIEGWKNTPYWVKDNPKYYDGALKGRRPRGSVDNFKAAGKPIGDQFTKIEKSISVPTNSALAIISSVHGDGVLKNIPFTSTPTAQYEAAFYHKNKSPIMIKLSKSATEPVSSIVHEMGHYFDLYAIGDKGEFSSLVPGSPAAKVVEVAKKSKAITKLQKEFDNLIVAKSKKEYLQYLLSNKEIFARLYTQYIAEASGNKTMLTEMGKAANPKIPGSIPYQWSRSDFAGIKKAMDEMMTELGWRVSR